MPLAVENLTKASSLKAVKDAVSESVSTCMGESTPEGMTSKEQQAQCVAMSLDIAREKTGRKLGGKA